MVQGRRILHNRQMTTTMKRLLMTAAALLVLTGGANAAEMPKELRGRGGSMAGTLVFWFLSPSGKHSNQRYVVS